MIIMYVMHYVTNTRCYDESMTFCPEPSLSPCTTTCLITLQTIGCAAPEEIEPTDAPR